MRGIPQSSLGAYTGANRLRGMRGLGDAPLFSLDNGFSIDPETGDVVSTPIYSDFPTVDYPGTVPTSPASTSSGGSWLSQARDLLNLYGSVTTAQNNQDFQARLNQINLQRAAAGQAPITAQQMASGQVPLSNGMKLAGFGIAGALLLVAIKGKRSRSRR